MIIDHIKNIIQLFLNAFFKNVSLMPEEIKIILKMVAIISREKYKNLSEKKLQQIIGFFLINNYYQLIYPDPCRGV